MLQQILKEMYIDPDVLDALNEDQKKTLFLKMRQEQVRRWKEREEKLEREGEDAECKRTKPKTDNSKSVSWMLGRDGDVAVIVIGEVDELSSKFISGFGEKKSPTLQNNAYLQTILKSKTTTEPIRAERENLPPITQPGVSLNLKGKCEERSASLPLPVSVREHLSPPAAAESPDATEKSVLQSTSCTVRSTPFSVRPASANAAPGSLNTRSEIQRPAAATPSTSLSNAVIANAKAPTGLHSQEPKEMQGSQGGKETPQAAASQETKLPSTCTGRGRVAQLMKTFSVENSAAPTQSAPRGIKPPLPSKPSHLRLTSTPTVR